MLSVERLITKSTASHSLNASLAESDFQDHQSQAFSRRLYINSITYLLEGLPSDLNEQETLQLQSVLPQSLAQRSGSEKAIDRPSNPSVLHRAIATIIISLCVLMQVLLPYLKHLFALACNYERTHHVTEQALAVSMTSVQSVGRTGTDLAKSVMENKAILKVIGYCIEGICGGVNEGLDEGVKVIGAPNTQR